MLLFNLLFHLF